MHASTAAPGFVLTALVLSACAQGSGFDPGAGASVQPGTGGTGGRGTGAGGNTSSSSGVGAGGGGGSGDTTRTGGIGGTGGTGTTSTPTSTCDFDAPAPCPLAEHLPSIDGDQDHDMRLTGGETSKWFDLQVMESVSSIFDFPQLSYTATLVSPPGTSYGLFVYTGDGSGPTCNIPPVQGTGDPPQVTDTWVDTPGLDDSRWITIEVRYLSGDACGPVDQWSLMVEGHTHP